MRATVVNPLAGKLMDHFFFPSRIKTMGLSRPGVIHVLSTDEDFLLIAVSGGQKNNSGPTGLAARTISVVYQARCRGGLSMRSGKNTCHDLLSVPA